MTNREFITELCRVTGEETEDIFIRGRRAGWLEAEDELDPELDIARKQQAPSMWPSAPLPLPKSGLMLPTAQKNTSRP